MIKILGKTLEIKTYKGFLNFCSNVKNASGSKMPPIPEAYKEIAKGIIGSKQARKLFMKYNKSKESYLYSLIREYLTRR